MQNTVWGRAARAAASAWLAANLLQGGVGLLIWRLFSPLRPLDAQNLWGVAPVESGLRGALLGVWLRWDAIHYLRIAQVGYAETMLSNFFPLYPLLGRWLGVGDELMGLWLLSRLAFAAALILLYRLTAVFADEAVAGRAVFACAFFPTAVYWLAPYPMSLALAWTLGAVWLAVQRRWLAAALCGLLAGLTHGTAAPLTLALLGLLVEQARRERRVWLGLPAAFTPALGTLAFFAWRTAQGFPNLNAVRATFWGRVVQPPWLFYQEFGRFFGGYTRHGDGWINFAILLLALLLTVWGLRRLPWPFLLYQAGMFLLLTVTVVPGTPFEGVGRYTLLMFPLYGLLAAWAKSPRRRLLLVALGVFFALGLAGVYFLWGWLA